VDKYKVLKDVFGHSEFRNGQEEIIDALMSGRDVLAVMPTGGGKSICYQIPALMSDGITIVVSPLISLMKDQVMSLVQSGVRAAYINSSLTFGQYKKVLANIHDGVYKIIYLAPERLLSEDFLSVCADVDVDIVAVDEAHCVSGWGQDFRPAYLEIRNFLSFFRKRPTVGAFTATATEKVRDDIRELLSLEAPLEITTGFDRPNLYFEVIKTNKKSKNGELLNLLNSRYRNKTGIIYCGTRSGVEDVAAFLNSNGYPALSYHAGMDDNARHKAQDDFIYDNCSIIVATNAFGMGIDKSNVSFVIHYNMPKDIESYYQEAGRAGRDGEKADCVLLWSDSDIVLNRFLIDKNDSNKNLNADTREELKRLEYYRLEKMTDYCKTMGCLRNYLLEYFGETSHSEKCSSCSNCTADFEIKDITEDSRKILTCIAMTDNTFGSTTITDILRGSMDEQIEKHGLDAISSYGTMKGCPAKYIRSVINALRIQGYIHVDGNSQYKVLSTATKAQDLLLGKGRVFMKKETDIDKVIGKEIRFAENQSVQNGGLLEQLKTERLRLARELSVPAYVIFQDSALYDMCRVMPKNTEELLTVSGVGKVKAAKYGEIFIEIIKKFS
jgi:ATP-dependent DNA helicase RecQ